MYLNLKKKNFCVNFSTTELCFSDAITFCMSLHVVHILCSDPPLPTPPPTHTDVGDKYDLKKQKIQKKPFFGDICG